MKKKLSRVLSLVLAMVMLLGATALAAEVSNNKMTITGIDGATVTFDTTVDEKINVTYQSDSIKDGQFYLVMVVAATKDENGQVSYVPTKDTILYIDQTVGEGGKIVFGTETGNAIYPSTIKDSAILIYGTGVDGEANSLIAAIIDAKYVIGDVNGDGSFNIADVTLLLQYIVGLASADEINEAAANVDGVETLTVSDVTKMLRVLVDLETF